MKEGIREPNEAGTFSYFIHPVWMWVMANSYVGIVWQVPIHLVNDSVGGGGRDERFGRAGNGYKIVLLFCNRDVRSIKLLLVRSAYTGKWGGAWDVLVWTIFSGDLSIPWCTHSQVRRLVGCITDCSGLALTLINTKTPNWVSTFLYLRPVEAS